MRRFCLSLSSCVDVCMEMEDLWLRKLVTRDHTELVIVVGKERRWRRCSALLLG